ncbi:hypothetical protein F0U61_53585 [Archangium violaceum]|uniref:hypothetical protein n=1 Tax=Archangium violaceum TaxID=83451 RepID=UPI002B31B44D|nr:hypothetical protein F0U61_53585 [Archangium violaceum]
MIAKCPCCKYKVDVGTKVGGKLGLAAAGAMLGANVFKKEPLMTLALIAGGAMLGNWVDNNVLPDCPSCRVALQLVNNAI